MRRAAHRSVVRFLLVGLSASALLASLLAACDDRGYGHHKRQAHAHCGGFSTCDTCTPVVGCGWCSSGPNAGTCVDGPDDCTAAQTSFTWDPPGCSGAEGGAAADGGGRTLADAQVGASDASDTLDASDVDATDASND